MVGLFITIIIRMYKQLAKRFKSYLSLYYIDSDFIMSALLSSWIFRGTLRQFLTSENSKSSSKMDKSTLHMGKSMGKSSSQWKILIKNGQIHIANGKSSSIVSLADVSCCQVWVPRGFFLDHRPASEGPSSTSTMSFSSRHLRSTWTFDRGILKEWSEYIHRKFMYGNLFWGLWSSSSIGQLVWEFE